MEPKELLRRADGADVDFLREGVRVLAQALMDAKVSAQIGAELSQRNPERTTQRNGHRARIGILGSARSTCRSPGP
jgi:putative transposase